MCRPCALLGRFGMNLALALDRLLNALTAGSSNETVSQRTARARAAGHAWAVHACAFLTRAARLLGSDQADHCTWSLEPGTLGEELWHWSPPVAAQDALAPSSSEPSA